MSKNTQLGNLVNGLFVDSTGNVGVGTTAPSAKLHTVGTLRVNNPSVSGQYMELYTSSGISYYNSQNNSAFYTAFQHIFNTDGTSATERMRINSDGTMILGGTSTSGTAGSGSGRGNLILGGSTSNKITFNNNSTTINGFVYSDSSEFNLTGSGYMVFNTGGSERMRIFASGNVRFSSQVYGNTVSSPRTLFIASDGELGGISSIRESKTNINTIDSNWLMQLNPVSFNYRKKDEDGKYTNEHYSELFYGLIAEETEVVNKEICTYNEDKLVGIEYSKLVPVLVKAIQELKAEIDILKQK